VTPRPLKLAVVGHTNTGKTSLVRTLLRSREFGQVADRAGTTRQVTVTSIGTDDALIELFDSPGWRMPRP
jgi:GTP-binding protein EngB required for normal cell division